MNILVKFPRSIFIVLYYYFILKEIIPWCLWQIEEIFFTADFACPDSKTIRDEPHMMGGACLLP